jgi:ribonuclease J
MLLAHARTALQMGLAASEVFVVEDGDTLELAGGRMRQGDSVPVGRVWLDDRGGLAVSDAVLKDRTLLGEMGVVTALVVVDRASGQVVRGPELSSRGVPHFEEGGPMYGHALANAREAVGELSPESCRNQAALEEALVKGVRRAFKRETGRRPTVVPVAVVV